jgi:hypothetical protein
MSTTAVPPGTCLIHGPFVGSACPTCTTSAVPSSAQIPGNEPARLPDQRLADELDCHGGVPDGDTLGALRLADVEVIRALIYAGEHGSQLSDDRMADRARKALAGLLAELVAAERARDELEAERDAALNDGSDARIERDDEQRRANTLAEALKEREASLYRACWELALFTFRGKPTSLGEETKRLFEQFRDNKDQEPPLVPLVPPHNQQDTD